MFDSGNVISYKMKFITITKYNIPLKFLKLLLLLACFWFFYFLDCTENPFGNDIKIAHNSISGKVELSDKLTPNDVYVWFKELNISTRTDKNGYFNLALPSPHRQPGGGVDGIFYLYFYVANYNLDSVRITITNGNLNISSDYMNDDGKLKGVITLTKLLDITTLVKPRAISKRIYNDTIFTEVTLRAFKTDVQVFGSVSKSDPPYLDGILLDSNKNFVKILRGDYAGFETSVYHVGNDSETIQPIMFKYEPGLLTIGNYEIIPYLVIQQKLPSGLIKSLGEGVMSLSEEYLKMPIKVKNNQFQVYDEIIY